MKKSILFVLSAMLGLPGLAIAQQALQVVRVNTDDVTAYLDWAAQSSTALLGDNVGAVGTCAPVFGAIDQGDIYFFTANPNLEALFSIDLNAPNIQQEVAKVAEIRTVVSRDVYVGLKVGPLPQGGPRWAQAILYVDTTAPARYVELLSEQESTLHENGFDDVSWAAYAINTGSSIGQVVSLLRAPTRARLGAALEAVQTAPWSNLVQGAFNDIRTVEQAMIADCEIYASNE